MDLFDLNWNVFLFWAILAVIAMVALMFRSKLDIGLPLIGAAIIWYFGTKWSVEQGGWLTAFWVATVIGLLVLAAARFFRAVVIGRVAAMAALVFSIVFATLGAPAGNGLSGVSLQELTNTMTVGIKSDLNATNAAIAAEKAERVGVDTMLQEQINALKSRVDKHDEQIGDLNKRVTALEQAPVVAVSRTATAPDTTPEVIASAVAEDLVKAGWNKEGVAFGTVDWSKNPLDGTQLSFGARIDTQEKLKRHIANSAL